MVTFQFRVPEMREKRDSEIIPKKAVDSEWRGWIHCDTKLKQRHDNPLDRFHNGLSPQWLLRLGNRTNTLGRFHAPSLSSSGRPNVQNGSSLDVQQSWHDAATRKTVIDQCRAGWFNGFPDGTTS